MAVKKLCSRENIDLQKAFNLSILQNETTAYEYKVQTWKNIKFKKMINEKTKLKTKGQDETVEPVRKV